jgi:hypothetical protein
MDDSFYGLVGHVDFAVVTSARLTREAANCGVRAISMKAIDRVMAAYAKVYKLSAEQASNVRKELTSFIEKLLDGRLPERPEKSN